MPIYQHRCSKCGDMELQRSMKDPSPTKCPQCKRPGLERIYSAYFHPPADMFNETKNKGAGEFYPQLGKQYLDPYTKTKLNPESHARSQNDAIEKFKRAGYQQVDRC